MGKLSGYKPRRLTNCLTGKVGIAFRSGGELNGWYILDGVQRLRVTAPKVHSGDVSPGTMKRIISSLRLDKEEFRRLYDCPMTATEYERKIRELIGAGRL